MSEISLKKIYSGKVRDLYEIDDKRMLMVASDRLSAFDVILDDPIPGKGEILTQISNFWFKKLAHIMPNHFTGQTVYDVLPENEAKALEKRAVVAKKLTPVKVEAIVRGYLAGSGWKDYQKTGSVCGIQLPEGMQEAQQLPEVILRHRPKPQLAITMKTSALKNANALSEKNWRRKCAPKRFSFIRKRPNMPNPAVSLFATPSLNLVWMKKVR